MAQFWSLSVRSLSLQMSKTLPTWNVSVLSRMSSKKLCLSRYLKMVDSLPQILSTFGTTTGRKSLNLSQLEVQRREVPLLQ